MARDFVIHTPEEISAIKIAAQAAAFVREQLISIAAPGMSTKELDDIAGNLIASRGGKSAFLGYRGYPGQTCISLNDKVVHGIGSLEEIMREGDVVSIDIGVNIAGAIGDTAKSFVLGAPAPGILMLLEKTEEALMAGISAALKGNYIRNISAEIEKTARKAGLGIVREYVGHGCGTMLHEPPEIPNFVTNNRGPMLNPGMVLAIEPMLNLGTHKVYTEPDNWTVRTLDRKVSAHFEHTVLITDNQPEILTWLKT
ncbi:MAG: type I methionyl aminopeptidase [Lentisphaerae bacterium GWF2_45_14]|nr:MAG: type I methionyl aminopeptidase [Lentisphaerae bacterium GWF2_45_14]